MLAREKSIEEVLGCKWTVSVLWSISDGVNRPGAMKRHIGSVSTKVLTDRLNQLAAYGLIIKTRYQEIPQRTEYHLTPFGTRVVEIVDNLRKFNNY